MAIAEHHPSELYKRNRGMLKMTHKQLHEFASKPRSSASRARFKRAVRPRV